MLKENRCDVMAQRSSASGPLPRVMPGLGSFAGVALEVAGRM